MIVIDTCYCQSIGGVPYVLNGRYCIHHSKTGHPGPARPCPRSARIDSVGLGRRIVSVFNRELMVVSTIPHDVNHVARFVYNDNRSPDDIVVEVQAKGIGYTLC